jgi:hypothetical protein
VDASQADQNLHRSCASVRNLIADWLMLLALDPDTPDRVAYWEDGIQYQSADHLEIVMLTCALHWFDEAKLP